jgi:hypothetical protein
VVGFSNAICVGTISACDSSGAELRLSLISPLDLAQMDHGWTAPNAGDPRKPN